MSLDPSRISYQIFFNAVKQIDRTEGLESKSMQSYLQGILATQSLPQIQGTFQESLQMLATVADSEESSLHYFAVEHLRNLIFRKQSIGENTDVATLVGSGALDQALQRLRLMSVDNPAKTFGYEMVCQSYLRMGDLSMAEKVLTEMPSGRQKEHLQVQLKFKMQIPTYAELVEALSRILKWEKEVTIALSSFDSLIDHLSFRELEQLLHHGRSDTQVDHAPESTYEAFKGKIKWDGTYRQLINTRLESFCNRYKSEKIQALLQENKVDEAWEILKTISQEEFNTKACSNYIRHCLAKEDFGKARDALRQMVACKEKEKLHLEVFSTQVQAGITNLRQTNPGLNTSGMEDMIRLFNANTAIEHKREASSAEKEQTRPSQSTDQESSRNFDGAVPLTFLSNLQFARRRALINMKVEELEEKLAELTASLEHVDQELLSAEQARDGQRSIQLKARKSQLVADERMIQSVLAAKRRTTSFKEE